MGARSPECIWKMDQEFEILAAKVLAGEASPEERARLDELLMIDPRLEDTLAEWDEAGRTLQGLGPILAALDAPRRTVPPKHLRSLEDEVKTCFAHSHINAVQEPWREEKAERSEPLPVWSGLLFGKGQWAAGAILGAIVVGSIVWWSHSTSRAPAAERSSSVVHFVLREGHAQLRRNGRIEVMHPVTRLQQDDQLSLAAGAKASAFTRGGTIALAGPRDVVAAEIFSLPPQLGGETKGDGVQTTEYLTALFGAATELESARLLLTIRGGDPIHIYSPIGATKSLVPTFVWAADPGLSYEITVQDELDSSQRPWALTAIRPPVEFAQLTNGPAAELSPDGLYRVSIVASDTPLSRCTATFRTLKDADRARPPTGSASLILAAEMLAADKGQTGDALGQLLNLPAPWATSELALRLKLLAFGRAGFRDEFELTLRQIQGAK